MKLNYLFFSQLWEMNRGKNQKFGFLVQQQQKKNIIIIMFCRLTFSYLNRLKKHIYICVLFKKNFLQI